MQKNAADSQSAAEVAKTAFSGLKGILGTFGLSLGLGALIGQVKELAQEAANAGKAYGRMYNTIYYTIGELPESQKELATTLGTEFDKTKVAETIARISVLFPKAETTMLEDGTTALESLSRELLWLDAKGFGDVSTTITEMNDAFKKWGISVEDATTALSYLRATYQDTNVDIATQLQYLAELDEAGIALGMTYQEMADFIGAAQVSGNIEDLASVGTTFETQYGNKVSAIRTALLAGDYSTLTPFIDQYHLDRDRIAGIFAEIADGLQVDAALAQSKAETYAKEITRLIFQAANEQAAATGTKEQAAGIWRDVLDLDGIRGGRIANRLADMSLAPSLGYADVRTVNRDKVREEGLTTTLIVTDIRGLGVSDQQLQNEAYKEAWLKDMVPMFSSWTPTVEKNIWNYERIGGYDPYLSSFMGMQKAYDELAGDVIDEMNLATMLINPLLGAVEMVGTDLYQTLLNVIAPLDETQVTNEYLVQPTGIQTWVETCAQQLSSIGDWIAGTDTTPEITVVQEQPAAADTWLATVSDQLSAIGDWFASLAPVGAASAADEVVFPEDLGQPVDYTDPLKEIGDTVINMNEGIAGMSEGITNLNDLLSGTHGDIYITQNFYTDTVDSYTVKNAATQAVRTAQAAAYSVRA